MQLQHTYDKMHDACIYLDNVVTNLCRKQNFNMGYLSCLLQLLGPKEWGRGDRRATVPPMPKVAVHSASCSCFDINITCKNN